MNNLYVIAYYINNMEAVCLIHPSFPVAAFGILSKEILSKINKCHPKDIEIVDIDSVINVNKKIQKKKEKEGSYN